MQPSKTKLKNIKRATSFKRGLASFFIASLAILLAGLVWFWGFLGRYERGTPDAALRELTTLINDSAYEEMYNRSDLNPSEYNSRDDYMRALRDMFPQDLGEPKYKKKSSKGGALLYSVIYADEERATIELVESDKDSELALKAKVIMPLNKNVEIVAPEHVRVYLNNNLLERSSAIVSDNTNPFYKKAAPELQPNSVVYTQKELLFAPIVTAKTPDGSECTVTENNGVFTVIASIGEEDAQEYQTLMQNGAKAYVGFVTKKVPLSKLDALVLKGSPLYVATHNFSNMWYAPHDSYSLANIQFSELYEYSQTAFSGIISFDHTLIHSGKTSVYPSTYRMIFVKSGDAWKMLELHVL